MCLKRAHRVLRPAGAARTQPPLRPRAGRRATDGHSRRAPRRSVHLGDAGRVGAFVEGSEKKGSSKRGIGRALNTSVLRYSRSSASSRLRLSSAWRRRSSWRRHVWARRGVGSGHGPSQCW
jgi:hypothetical protein